jgi:phosphoglycolate phosphatase-like HAD superfamily hydrolase
VNIKHDYSFSWMACDAYLFDIDGTLLRAHDLVHYNALNRAMREVYGKNTTIDGVQYHGMTDLGILRAALARAGVSAAEFEGKLPEALAAVCQDVEENVSRFEPLVSEAIPAVLEELRTTGKLLGVASGNLESVGWHKITAAGLREFFNFGVFSDRHEARAEIFARGVALVKERLGAHASVCFIGDTPQDIRAARDAGAQIISVGTGVFSRADLESLRPDLCVNNCGELLENALRK